MQGSSAFSLTLCIRVAILLACNLVSYDASVVWVFSAEISGQLSIRVAERRNVHTRLRLNAVDAPPARRRAPLLVDNTTSSYHRPDPSSGTMLPEVIALLYDGARPWSSI